MTATSHIPSVLQRIVATKHEEVATAKEAMPLADLKSQAMGHEFACRLT